MNENAADLLVVSYHLPPYLEPQSILVGRLLDHLPASFRLHVVTADDSGALRDSSLYAGLEPKFADQIRIPYAGSLSPMLLRKLMFPVFRVPDDRILWHVKAYRSIIRKWSSSHFDAILTFSYPLSSNLLGLWLKKAYHVPWVAFFSDPWVDSPYTNYRLLLKSINNRLERRTMTGADALVFASREMRSAYVRKYPFIEEKAVVLEHSFDPRQYPEPAADRSGRLTFRYLGTVNRVRTPTAMLTAVGELAGTKGITDRDACFEFYGGADIVAGILMSRLRKRYGLERIVVSKGPVPYRESLAVMQGADVLVVIDADFPGSVFVPSKLMDYIGAGKPVLGITPLDSATARVIRETGGWVVSPKDTKGFVDTFLSILDHYRKGTLERFRPSPQVQERYAIRNHADAVVGLVEETIERARHAAGTP